MGIKIEQRFLAWSQHCASVTSLAFGDPCVLPRDRMHVRHSLYSQPDDFKKCFHFREVEKCMSSLSVY